ncbi:SemiSWEET family sugar transporter [Leifsonia sp. L25]|uniref:SemiSWEET family sugar transporter n=1 Tax=Actinomycetes TaxID=1760 RepID=UPI003D681C35
MSLLTVLGSAAAILTTGAWLPQLLRCWRTRSTGDISWSYVVVLGSGVTLWVTYGIAIADPVVFVANTVTLAALAALAILKVAFVGRASRNSRSLTPKAERGRYGTCPYRPLGAPRVSDPRVDPPSRPAASPSAARD